jgi:hypothetical protein
MRTSGGAFSVSRLKRSGPAAIEPPGSVHSPFQQIAHGVALKVG